MLGIQGLKKKKVVNKSKSVSKFQKSQKQNPSESEILWQMKRPSRKWD